MRHVATIFLSLFACITLQAQPFAITWLHHPSTASGDQVWFRTEATLDGDVADATLSVCTTGRVDIYVNERNVTSDVLIPYRENAEPTAVTTDFDVARFLRNGPNTIAVWYAPLDMQTTDRQVAVMLCGRYNSGKRFTIGSDDGWMCHTANRRTTATGEAVDATAYTMKWNSDDIDIATWLPATTLKTDETSEHRRIYDPYMVEKMNKIRPQERIYTEGDTLVYDFGNTFRGWVRVTMRGRKRGERLTIGNLTYTCRAQTDEQAFHKFTIGLQRKVVIKSTEKILPENIFSAEAIEIVPFFRYFCFY